MAFDNNVDNANDGQQLAIKWLWWWFKNDNDIADDTRNALMMHSVDTQNDHYDRDTGNWF